MHAELEDNVEVCESGNISALDHSAICGNNEHEDNVNSNNGEDDDDDDEDEEVGQGDCDADYDAEEDDNTDDDDVVNYDYNDEDSMLVRTKANMPAYEVEELIKLAMEDHRNWIQWWSDKEVKAVQMLEDDDWHVRSAVLKTLGELPSETLNRHGDAIVHMLKDVDKCVRLAALETLGKFTSSHTVVGVLDVALLQEVWFVLMNAMKKKSRPINHWSNARAFI